MKLHHSTKVQAPPEEVWGFLQDIHAVVACLPGAELTGEKGDDQYDGVLRVAIGPLKLLYNGQVDITQRDGDARRLELAGSGRDRRGGGSVRADVRVEVVDVGDGSSQLDSVTDLQLTGRVAALGRGVQDVSNMMFSDFSRRLAERVGGTNGPIIAAGSETQQVRPNGAAPVDAEPAPGASSVDATSAGSEIKLLHLVISVTRQRLADLFQRWSEKVRP